MVCQVSGRGVHSFCMCPGGIIAPCATEDGEVVTNGWSPSKRNNPYANSGMVVQLNTEDWERLGHQGPLGGLEFQRVVEKACWQAAGGTQRAPAQRLVDFLKGVPSVQLPKTSYLPGVVAVNLHDILPSFIAAALQEPLARQQHSAARLRDSHTGARVAGCSCCGTHGHDSFEAVRSAERTRRPARDDGSR